MIYIHLINNNIRKDKMTFNCKTIKKINLTLLSPNEIEKKAVVKIISSELFSKDNKPSPNGLFDNRMGPYNKYSKCKTCYNDFENCPGHFGYIELETPVIYLHFIKYIKKILNCVCHCCSYLMISDCKDLLKILLTKKKDKRLNFILSYMEKNKNNFLVCQKCKKTRVKFFKDKVKFFSRDSSGVEKYYTATGIYDILNNIKDSDLAYVGFDEKYSKPSWMICTNLLVVPPCIRPSVTFNAGNMRSEDDLTFKLIEIIRANNKLKLKKIELKNVKNKTEEEIAKMKNIIERQIDYLEYHVFTYYDNNHNSIPNCCHKSGRSLKTLKERIIGKTGRIRSNITGKRVNYSSRSVVSPEPLIDIDQLGVPLKICMKMTYKETVNYWNHDKLLECVRNGPDTYPGARYIILTNKIKKDLNYIDRNNITKLNYGDVIERHLMEGDVVLFNRQPSLHKFSMMGHFVKPLIGNSFRLNPNVAAPYNADFDGDEMNMHVPRSVHTETELREIGLLSKNIISPQSNKPIIGFIMDTTLGSAKLSENDKLLTETQAKIIIASIDSKLDFTLPEPVGKSKIGESLYRGIDLYSLIMPRINYHNSGKTGDVIINNGKIMQGIFDKKIIGASAGGLIHTISNDLSDEKCKVFMGNAQRLLNNWLKQKGFSIGFSDVIITEQQTNDIKKILNNAESAANEYINRYLVENKKISKDDFEKKIFVLLNDARNETESVTMDNLNNDNSLYAMVNSGSKGNFINISQIMACVGQQNIQSGTKQGRIPFTYHKRTIPHFQKYDISPEARGFIKTSYLQGLTPTEFFFHKQSGREGLIDTAVKTSETGYIQRKLMKAMEDSRVLNDMTVRNELGNILEFIYGGDGIDAKYMEKQTFDLIMIDNEEFNDKYKWNSDKNFLEEEKTFLKDELLFLKNMRKHYREKEYYKEDLYAPINYKRLIKQSKQQENLQREKDLTLSYYILKIKELLNDFFFFNHSNIFYKKINKMALRIIKTLIRSNLSSKRSIQEYKLKQGEFEWIIQNIYKKFYKSIVQPGEGVGAIAAQSISEPTTQLSVDYDTSVIVKEHGKMKCVKIGKYIDDMMSTNEHKLIDLEITNTGKSTVLNFDRLDLSVQVPSISNTGKVSWKPLTQVSRHPPNGKMVKIITKTGKEIVSTLSHTFLTEESGKIIPIRGDELKVGTKLPINNSVLSGNDFHNKRIDEVLRKYYSWEDREKIDMILEYASMTDKLNILDLL